ncbi:MAG: hypothetical protein M3P01_11835 [Actinomycetota bacterium]|nr:hypothetical protein [Actinomycetota bacterium]
MIKKLAALGATVGAVTTAILLASLVPASSHGAITKRFTVCEKGNSGFVKNIDVGKHGFSAGDYQVNSTPAYHAGHRVATDVGKQTVVRRIGKHDAQIIVDATMILHAGKVSAYGPARVSRFAKGVSFPVTGGTGLYRKAVGTARVEDGSCVGKPGIRLHFRLAIQ